MQNRKFNGLVNGSSHSITTTKIFFKLHKVDRMIICSFQIQERSVESKRG